MHTSVSENQSDDDKKEDKEDDEVSDEEDSSTDEEIRAELKSLFETLWVDYDEIKTDSGDIIQINENLEYFYSNKKIWSIWVLSKKRQVIFNSFANKISDRSRFSDDLLLEVLNLAYSLKSSDKYSEGRYQNALIAIEFILKYELEVRWADIIIDEEEAQKKLIKHYVWLWFEYSWTKALWEWLWWVVAYWKWEITNDPYLSEAAKKDLNIELGIDSSSELPPIKIFKNLYKFGDKVLEARKVHKIANSIVIEDKISKQMPKRWWSKVSIQNTIKNSKEKVKTKDTRYKSDWTRRNDNATAYISEDWNYVVVNDKDNTIVQISDKLDPNWKSPF